MSVKVAFFTRYEKQGASSRYRFIQYFDIYRLKGLEPVHLPFYRDKYLQNRYAGKTTVLYMIAAFVRRFTQILISRNKYPLIVIEYEILPYFPRIIDKLALLWIGSPYIVEYDDAVYTRYESVNMMPFRSKITGFLQEANLIIAGSNYLGEQLKLRGAKSIAVVPTSVSSRKFVTRHEHNNDCTIVWIGSSTTAKYINEISSVLRRLLNNKVNMVIIGAGNWRLDCDDNVIYKEWSEDEEADLLSKCDIGIMPLPDTNWARGKCGLKIIQYMMAGLPVVASNVGANTEIVSPGIDGFLASGEDEWYEYLNVLISNLDQRRQMGENGRRKALERFCVEGNAAMIMNLYINEMEKDDPEIMILRQRLKVEGREE